MTVNEVCQEHRSSIDKMKPRQEMAKVYLCTKLLDKERAAEPYVPY